jgi:phosphate transport system substrate-binding protein
MKTFCQKNISRPFGRLAAVLTVLFGVFTVSAQDKITIRGSNTIGEELAPRLITEYKKSHGDTTFDLEFKGSSYGIGALMGNFCDIAGSSKPISKEQKEIAQIRGIEFKEYILGSYSVSILVNAANPVSNLTSDQVESLFTGKVQNWKQVGGPDAPVHPYARDPVSGTYLGFKELAMGFQDYGTNVQYFTNYNEIAKAVAKDPQGIGYAGLLVTPSAGAKVVSINDVTPNVTNVNGKKYPYVRQLYFYTDAAKEPAPAKNFIDFVLSSDGQKVLTDMGYAPKP